MPNRGFGVPPLTSMILDESFQLRLMLEVSAVSKVVGILSEMELAHCDAAMQRRQASAQRKDGGLRVNREDSRTE